MDLEGMLAEFYQSQELQGPTQSRVYHVSQMYPAHSPSDLTRTICCIADQIVESYPGSELIAEEKTQQATLKAALAQALLDLARADKMPDQLAAADALLAVLPQPVTSVPNEQARKIAARETLLGHLIAQIRRSLDLGTIWEQSARAIAEAFNADFCGILLRQEDGSLRMVHRYAAEGVCSPTELDISVHPFHQLFPEVAQQAAPTHVLRSCDLTRTSSPALTRQVLLDMGIRAEMTAPIQVEGKTWGRLIVGQLAVRLWSDDEAELIQAVADHLAMAIAQAELYQQLRVRNADLDQRVHERTHALEQALRYEQLQARLGNAIRSSLDEAKILQIAVQELGATLGADACHAGLLTSAQARGSENHNTENRSKLDQITVQYEYLNPTLRKKADRKRVSYLGQVLKPGDWPQNAWKHIVQGLPYVSVGTAWGALSPSVANKGRIVKAIHNSTATIVYPIQDDQGLIGILSVLEESRERPFQESEVQLVGRIAAQCAIAIRQARLYQQSCAQVEALTHLNYLKDDFLGNVSHELRTPLSSMRLAIQMLSHQVSPDRFNTYLKILETECQREIELVEDLLDLQRLETGRQALCPYALDLNEQLPRWLSLFHASSERRHQTFTLNLQPNPLPLLTTEVSSLKRIVVELLDNACKYTPDGNHIWLDVQGNQQEFVLKIGNLGVQIPSEELPHIFEKFRRAAGQNRWATSGTGLGLALVQQLVKRIQGSIEVSSDENQTLFTLRLPQLKSDPAKFDPEML
ncbi:GAF domain-containing sensor histidine kinase [Leptolyngbya sp. FACHB-261]|uniref:GAF domain-containing sensor histidine kinase n=1 Tax=Leptolyngbya sp. FACHB-261 TaxID=2692806 RepID=UPI0016837704|nr:GAF domain-containing sensor histidine kinase [Leptolyngbya sp. FACHB-261]MBD2103470.1 GAF domain-containing sensor histidine kinase [Leptolyngbya sp. FACHB-261]